MPIFEADAAPISDGPILVDPDADQLTFETSSDVYPLSNPSEENASREGKTVRGAFGTQTLFLEPLVSLTPIDLSTTSTRDRMSPKTSVPSYAGGWWLVHSTIDRPTGPWAKSPAFSFNGRLLISCFDILNEQGIVQPFQLTKPHAIIAYKDRAPEMTSTTRRRPRVGNWRHRAEFTLSDQHAIPSRSAFPGKRCRVFVYPAAFSAGCTAEACAFRDSHEVFKEAGAEVIGISMDSVEKQNSFAKRFNLTYTLLADDGTVWKAFGVSNRLGGLLRGRVTYVIDKQGVVQHLFNSQVKVLKHVNEALETLKNMA